MNGSEGNSEQPAWSEKRTMRVARVLWPGERALHPSWEAFYRLCAEMQYGEIERLKIQDGLPVLAEVVTKKIKF